MSILIENLTKKFGGSTILDCINLEIKTGHLGALLGPSGSGKSTLLKIIAGLEKPNQGTVWLSGKESTNVYIQQRQIGFVFQNYALFNHLTVFQNIAFGLQLRKASSSQVEERVRLLLKLIQLEKFTNAFPVQLSGGQKQRVALARALAIEPSVLLLDEPFGALDIQVRKNLRVWLKKLHEQVSITTLFVTHDQQDAIELANEIVILNQGKIEQVGNAQEIHDHPANDFVLKFLSYSSANHSKKI